MLWPSKFTINEYGIPSAPGAESLMLERTPCNSSTVKSELRFVLNFKDSVQANCSGNEAGANMSKLYPAGFGGI